jgi:hypothetical protein
MISSLNDNVNYIFVNYPVQLVIFLISIIVSLLAYKIYRYKVSIDYKIYKPILNYLAITLYISYYIIALLIIRFYMWNKSIDLNVFINKIKELHSVNGILILLFIFSIWTFFIACLITLRKTLIKEIIKYHIYIYSHYDYTSIYRKLIRNHYFRSLKTCEQKLLIYSWKFTKFLINLFNYKYKDVLINKLGKSNSKLESFFVLRIIPILLLIILFLYDCYFNNWIITKMFYYLPFYLLYNLWYQTNSFLDGNHIIFDRVIYERYYKTKDILYVNTTDEEEEFLETYIKKGFKYNYTLLDLEELIPPIVTYRRFVRIPNTNIFENAETGISVKEEECVEKHKHKNT